ncbi:retention module-containing protein, partial [Shewanella gelidimarina]|uniref:retention module-containing protein n=1 Tax=Shewanella gelidimarina TaxID=56813 RepID=UPI0020103B00
MKSIITTQAGHIQNLTGTVTATVNGAEKQVAVGELIPEGTLLSVPEDSFVEIQFDDGSLTSSNTESTNSLSASPAEENVSSDAALDEIAEIQALIASGEDPTEGPDTAAGNSNGGNEGSSGFLSVSRSATETIAASGFTTAGTDQTEFTETRDIDLSVDNIPSILANDSNSIAEDGIASGNVLDNDSDGDDALTVVSFTVDGQTVTPGSTVELDGGSLVINEDGSYTFTPNENWNGSVPVITYTTNTGSTATLTIEVTPVDDASVLANDSQTIDEDSVATGNVLDNDGDVDSDLTVVSFEVDGQSVTAGSTVELEGGSLVINADGSYTFTPNDNWNGSVPVITYTTNTGSTATLTIEVTPVDDASVLANDSQTIDEESVATGNVL